MNRRVKVLVGVAVASLGLSACSVPMALSQAQNTVGGSDYFQAHLTASVTSADPAATVLSKALGHLTFEFNEQSLSGLAIKNSLNQVNEELVVRNGTTRVATLLEHQSNLYVNLDFAAWSQLAGSRSLASLNLLLGERWIELPFSLVSSFARTSSGLRLSRSSVASDENRLLDATVNLLTKGDVVPTSQGYSESGSLAALARGLRGTLSTFASKLPNPKVSGTYDVTVTMSGSTANGASLDVVTPSAKYGNTTIRVQAVFAHQNVAVTTPTNALVITPSLIKQFGGSASGLLTSSLG